MGFFPFFFFKKKKKIQICGMEDLVKFSEKKKKKTIEFT
jgi:hypothetical protein